MSDTATKPEPAADQVDCDCSTVVLPMLTLDRWMLRFWRRYKIDADLIECLCCRRRVIATRWDEAMNHAAGCTNWNDPNPWVMLAEALSDAINP